MFHPKSGQRQCNDHPHPGAPTGLDEQANGKDSGEGGRRGDGQDCNSAREEGELTASPPEGSPGRHRRKLERPESPKQEGRSSRSRSKTAASKGERDKSRDGSRDAAERSSSLDKGGRSRSKDSGEKKGAGTAVGVGVGVVARRKARSLNRGMQNNGGRGKRASAPPTTTTTTAAAAAATNASATGNSADAASGSAATGSRAVAAQAAEAELSVDARAPGVIKLFGESVVHGAQYKAVLASTRSTSQELVKQALERYGLPTHTFPSYVLCDCVGVVCPPRDTDDERDDRVGDKGNDGAGVREGEAGPRKDSNLIADVPDDDNSDPSYASIGCGDSGLGSSGLSGVSCGGGGGGGGGGGAAAQSSGGWTPVSSRVLDDADRPLVLQMYWKPPEGLSRRFELHRRDDVVRETSEDDTSGLNDNARRIMMSKVPPGAIPPPALPPPLPASPGPGRRGSRVGGGDYSKTGPEGRPTHQTLSFPNANAKDRDNNNFYRSKGPSSPDSDAKYAYVCPSIYPYLLTLRGRDIRKDLVLYPLKSKTLTVGRSHHRSRADDIGLAADDVLDLHCRIHLKTLPADHAPGLSHDRRKYWYYLHVEVFERAVVFVNGVRVEDTAVVQPGDLLGVGHHYLFLYKDPTGGFDIPESLPWYPGVSSLYAKVQKGGGGGGKRLGGSGGDGGGGVDLDPVERDVLNAMVNEVNSQDYFELDDVTENGSMGETPLVVPYRLEREEEVLDHIASISCSSPADFPLTTTVLLMGCHGYAARRFPPAHQAGFFRRLLRTIRNRVSVVSKALSVQKYQSTLYLPPSDPQKDDDSRDGDPLLELLCWLSNVVRIYNHVTSADFRSRLVSPPPDVIESLHELVESLEEMISFMFQQTVYSITKVLFAPVGQILHPPSSPNVHADSSRAMAGMERVLHVLKTTLDVSEDVSLHPDVIVQLLTYLIFFVTTTLFNKLMSKGGNARYFSWSVGVRLQACVSSLEDWVSSVGLEAQYLRVSERLLSLVDLLATSRHTLLRMDWPSFRKQYSPLAEAQLLKVLTEYQFTDGQTAPASWLPPPGVQPSEEVAVSLSSHPPFVLPRQGPGVDLKDTFPPPLHAHLDAVTKLFSRSADGSPADRPPSDRSTPRQGDMCLSSSRAAGSHGTFFTSDVSPNVSHHQHHHLHDKSPPPPPPQQQQYGLNGSNPQSPPLPQRHRTADDGSPPPKLPPRSSTIQFADPPVQPPYPQSPHRGILSPRCSGKGVANVSARCRSPSHHGPSSNYSGGLSQSARPAVGGKVHDLQKTGVGGDARVRDDSGGGGGGGVAQTQDAAVHDRLTQSARAPVYAAPANAHSNSNSSSNGSNSARSHNPNHKGQPASHHYHQGPPPPHNPGSSDQLHYQSSKRERERDPPPYHKTSTLSLDKKHLDDKRDFHPDQHHHQQSQHSSGHSQDSKSAQDPRRRPLNGVVVPAEALALRDKRIIHDIPPLELPPEDLSNASDSAVSDDVFVQSCTDVNTNQGFQSSEFRRFSTGMLSKERAESDAKSDKPEVVQMDMRLDPESGTMVVDQFPEDIYIDVLKEVAPSSSARQLKVLPLEDGPITNGYDSDPSQSGEAPRVRYRHKMPQERDSSTKGEITGEVFTLTLFKEGSRLGMGLIDGMYTPLKLPGIYVRNVLPGTPAALCGHIRVGDRILAVNGKSIVGADYNSAMKLIRMTGPRLNLLIAKCDRSVTARISAS